MKIALTPRRMAILTAIHQHGEALPSTICHATNLWPGSIYPTLDLFVRAGWLGRKPHPTRPGARLYHLTLRGQLGAGLEPAGGDDGPSVQEAAADDRRYWDCEKAGE